MQFDQNNKIVKLCAEGMDREGRGEKDEALKLFRQAWNEASNDFEKFISAHYIARRQETIEDKLKWDETALQLALKINDETVKDAFPSLYLNIGKCYEDLNDVDSAMKNYDLALSYAGFLPDDGYGNMIKSGITQGIKRVSNN
ncbi:hypothetical protein ACE1ET_04425 [Saccharicrinis sp. FJH62]|uniref:hypothetical protein n=1 Tax=Saccharicrinis sp. FJH62 TaxID=3344657 RepID=UPI0035D3F954